MADLTLRRNLDRPLSIVEGDGNIEELAARAAAVKVIADDAANDITTIAGHVDTIDSQLYVTAARVIPGAVTGANTQGTGDLIGLRTALTMRAIVNQVSFIPTALPGPDFQVRFYAMDNAALTSNTVLRALPAINVTGAVVGTLLTINVNQYFNVGEYIYIGLPVGVKTHFSGSTPFSYRAATPTAAALPEGYVTTMQLLNGMPISWNLTDITTQRYDLNSFAGKTTVSVIDSRTNNVEAQLSVSAARLLQGVTSGTLTLGTGDLIGIKDVLTVRTMVNQISFIPTAIPGAAFQIRLYALSGVAASGNVVLRALPAIDVTGAVVGSVLTINVMQVFDVGEYVFVGLAPGVKTYYGSTSVAQFAYKDVGASILAMQPGATSNLQILNGMPITWRLAEISAERYDLATFAKKTDIAALDARTTDVEAQLRVKVLRTITGSSGGALMQGTGDLIGIRNALTIKTIVKQIIMLPGAGTPADFTIRLYAFSSAATTGNTVLRVLPAINVTGAVVGTLKTIDINQSFNVGEYIWVGLPVGVKLIYNVSNGVPFVYRAGIANANSLTEGYVTTGQLLNGNPIAWVLNEVTSTLIDLGVLANANALAGKKIIAGGDSMVYGHTLGPAASWLAKIAARNGMTAVNYGINGNRLTDTGGSGTPLVNRFTTFDTDADFVVIFIGTNDANGLVTMGDDAGTDITTFKGALNVLCTGLINRYPAKKILFITPYKRNANYQAYVTAIEVICLKYGIPVFNNITRGGVDWTNAAQVAALTLDDTYHLNDAGLTYVSTKYEAAVRSL